VHSAAGPAAARLCFRDIRRESYWKDGIRHIVALRGDATPEMGGTYVPHPQGYAYADTLVAGLKEIGDFEISVAAYPETHPQAKTRDEDLRHLKRKFDAGASLAISQYCFDMDYYKAFLAKLPEYDIDPATVVPGILPIGNFTQMAKFSAMCGASVPAWLQNRFEGEDPAGAMHAQLAVATAYKQALDYLATGTQRLHFYTLNRADLVMAVCRLLGIRG
jgi:methylenetetrahydrofolate reductase (NADPH)